MYSTYPASECYVPWFKYVSQGPLICANPCLHFTACLYKRNAVCNRCVIVSSLRRILVTDRAAMIQVSCESLKCHLPSRGLSQQPPTS